MNKRKSLPLMSSSPSLSTSSRQSATSTARATATATSSSQGSSSVTVVTVTSSSPSTTATSSSSTVNVECTSSPSGSRCIVRTTTTSQNNTADNELSSNTVDDGVLSSSTAPALAASRPSRSVPLVLQPTYRFILHFRKGVRGDYKAKSANNIPSSVEWSVKSGLTFDTLLALIRAFSIVHAPLVWPQDDLPDIIPSPSKGARLQAAVTLNKDNFLEIIGNSWRLRTGSGKHDGALQLIIYMAEPVALSTPSSSNSNILCQPTAARMPEVRQRLDEQEDVDELGGMERAYHEHTASKSKRPIPPPGNTFALPNNTTSRQARRAHMKRRADKVEGLEDDEYVPVRVKLDLEVTLKMSRQDLAKAIGLPSGFNLSSNFSGRNHAGNPPSDA
ncbi:MAG: hypothetical protein J3R72DRAFT_436089 [Linnemannia gamsii]|nr:MAG: hypothetical protein J3R72DRAFT_436089 [Linnemannia gamsii]